jgi:hypothetical protein
MDLPSWSLDRSALNGWMIASADGALQVNLKQKLYSSFISTLACQSSAQSLKCCIDVGNEDGSMECHCLRYKLLEMLTLSSETRP